MGAAGWKIPAHFSAGIDFPVAVINGPRRIRIDVLIE
jgi:hypothetical protein